MARKTVTCAFGLVLAATAFAWAGDEAAWQQAMADYQRFGSSKDAAERARAAEAVGNATFEKHDKQTVQMMAALLLAELARDKGGKDEEKVSGDVLEQCENALKKITNPEAVDMLIKMTKAKEGNPRAKFYYCRALGAQKTAVKVLIELADDKDIKVQIGALDGLTAAKDPAALDTFIKVLGATDRTWECKFVSLAGIEALDVKDDKVVDALIDALGKCKQDEGRIKVEIMRILGNILDIKDPKSDDPNWWRSAKKDKETPVGRAGTTIEPTEFFGLKTKSTRIVFALDRTGSMQEACTWPEPKKGDKEPPKEGPGTATGAVGADGKPITPDEDGARQKAAELKKKYDERKVTSKMDGLKKEFINTIYNLDPRVSFTVIWYESNPTYWKEQLVPATWKIKLECIQDIDKLNPSGPTNVWSGIESAFKLIEQPARPDVVQVDKKGNYATVVNGADTVYLMTDGIHNTGKFVKDAGTLQASADETAFIAELKKVNALRKIQIHAIALGDQGPGLPPAAIQLMKRIAAETGGNFVHIGR